LSIRWKKLAVPLLVVLIAAAALLMTNRAVTPKEATWDDVLQEARSGGYQIITTDDLKQRYQHEADKVMLVDTRQDWEFNSGHISGAVSFPMEPTWWSRWKKRDSMQAVLGPDMNRFIVFY
jgi:3-mercaptopyruvate sulfurtransferase SseA